MSSCPIKENGILEYIRPGEKPRCGCVSAAVIPAFGSWKPATDVSAYA